MSRPNEQAAQERLLKKANKFANVFSTKEGKEVLELLKEEFEPVKIFDENPHKTSYNAGRRDVVQYIEQMMRINHANKENI